MMNLSREARPRVEVRSALSCDPNSLNSLTLHPQPNGALQKLDLHRVSSVFKPHFHCNVSIARPHISSPATMAPDGKARKDLCARFAKYYDNDALSDFTIRCRQTTWKVHRFVLSLHSGALAACCSDGFKVSGNNVSAPTAIMILTQ
jgi:hypothetical protein